MRGARAARDHSGRAPYRDGQGKHMTERWRLLVDGPGEPSWNMAVDEALLRTAPDRDATPTLRLYWWRPAALSLGANQESEFAVDWEALAGAL